MKIRMAVCLLASFSLTTGVLAQTIYSGKDKQGNPVFSDQPMPNTHDQNTMQLNSPNLSNQQQQQATDRYQNLMQSDKELSDRLKKIDEERKMLRQKIAEAQIMLKQVEQALNDARDHQAQMAAQCNPRGINQFNQNVNVNCNFPSLAPLEADVAKAKAQLKQLQLQLQRFPR
ncbi:MAG: DUF4124 domain-containing protein [Legionellales bacterium]|nr:DUF4124 domain-containing protein [Legionellales bacterium]